MSEVETPREDLPEDDSAAVAETPRAEEVASAESASPEDGGAEAGTASAADSASEPAEPGAAEQPDSAAEPGAAEEPEAAAESGSGAEPEESQAAGEVAEAAPASEGTEGAAAPAAEAEAPETNEPEAGDAGAESAGEEAGEAAENGAPTVSSVGVPGMDWYIIHTYSGFENKVRDSIRTRSEAFGMETRFGEILIPTEDVIEMKGGKKVTSKRLLYPGYVLVQLDMDDEMWHVIKNTPRVTGFVGGGQNPTPLTADEVNQILYRQSASVEKPRPKMAFEKSDQVKIIDGPFSNFTGSVEEVNTDRNTVKVMVTIFGRGTPVELEYFQVEKE